jgi:DNA modification methylase
VLKYVTTRALPLDQLETFPGNPNIGDVPKILESLKANGQFRSLIIRHVGKRYVIMAGNHTKLAMVEHGPDECGDTECRLCATGWDGRPRCEVYTCDDDTAIKINLADNRIPEYSHRDDDAVISLIRGLSGDVRGTGYEAEDELVRRALADEPVLDLMDTDEVYEEADTPEIPDAPEHRVTRRGDVWQLGDHRLMCGDCRSSDDVSALLAGAVANLAVTSPPYAKQRDYDTDSEFRPVPPDEYVDWFEPVSVNVADHLAEDGSWFINIKSTAEELDNQLYVMDLVIAHARRWGWHFATEFCWERIGVPKWVKRRFKNQFEPVYQFTRGDWKIRPDAVRHPSDSVPVPGGPGTGDTNWKNRQGGGGSLFGGANVSANQGKPSRATDVQGTPGVTSDVPGGGLYPRTRVTKDMISDRQGQGGAYGPTGGVHGGPESVPGLAYPGNRLPTFSGSHTATGHTAAFPVGLPQFFVRAYTDAGDVVYDPFCGSGSTLLAADNEGRTGYGMEISPKYVDVACMRFQQVTGVLPVRDGEPYDFLTD